MKPQKTFRHHIKKKFLKAFKKLDVGFYRKFFLVIFCTGITAMVINDSVPDTEKKLKLLSWLFVWMAFLIGYLVYRSLRDFELEKPISTPTVASLIQKFREDNSIKNSETGKLDMLENDATNKDLLEQIDLIKSKEAKSLELDNKLSVLSFNIEEIIKKLELNSRINLAIGSTTTFATISILSLTIIKADDYKDWFVFLTTFLPRVSLVAVIQIFAYFFLSLYKNNLKDIKFYNNELTTINSKIIAMKIAFDFDKEGKTDESITELINLERNKQSKENETSMDKEKEMGLELIKVANKLLRRH